MARQLAVLGRNKLMIPQTSCCMPELNGASQCALQALLISEMNAPTASGLCNSKTEAAPGAGFARK